VKEERSGWQYELDEEVDPGERHGQEDDDGDTIPHLGVIGAPPLRPDPRVEGLAATQATDRQSDRHTDQR
jgi:hypothetical protein